MAKHNTRISCIKPLSVNPNLFLSGSLDSTVKLWDIRNKNEVRKNISFFLF